MWKRWIAGFVLALCLYKPVIAQESYETRAKKYIEQFRDMAVAEQRRTGIPAAITLAQGIHETNAGISPLAVDANNHFGIKCKKSWQGETYTYTDDAPDECFRKYSSPEDSYKDHSDYLSHTPRYASLFKLSSTDYASWAIGLKQAGYATNPRYAQILIKLIENYHLQEYTYAALDNNMLDKPAGEVVPEQDVTPAREEAWVKQNSDSRIKVEQLPAAVAEVPVPAMPVIEQPVYPPYGQPVKVNGLKAVYAKKGDMPLEYAISQDIRYERLLEINEIDDKPLPADMYLYLERKHFKGTRPTHTVQAGETLAKVAQYEGMQVKYIRSFNQLKDNEEPAEGTVLYLQENAPAKAASAPAATVPATTVETMASTADVTTQPQEAPKEEVVAAPVKEEATTAPEVVPVNTSSQEAPVQFADQKTETPVAQTTAAVKTDIGPIIPETPKQPEAQAVATDNTVASEAALPPPPPASPSPTHVTDPGPVTVTPPPYNIANEKPVEEVIKEEKAKAKQQAPRSEADDELDALKARFDKVVYAPATETPAAEPTPTPETTVQEPVAEEHKTEQKATASSGPKFYTVKKGDTAFNIAKRNNITVTELMEWNKLDFSGIKIGQKLQVKP